jgi:hypothetical protein
MLAPGRNRAQFLTPNRNTQIRGKTRSYDLRFRRATADPSYVVYVQMIEQSNPDRGDAKAMNGS